MMKRIFAVFLAALLLLAALCGCGASSKTADSATEPYAYSAPSSNESYEYTGDSEPMESAATADSASGGTSLTALTQSGSLTDKIIYTAEAEVETVNFDGSVSAVAALIEKYGGFIEASYVSGAGYRESYYGYQTYRDASFTIRVPRENYSGLTGSLEELGSVVRLSAASENITVRYTDAEARLTTYKTEETRLLEMIESANTVEDMITIESRLSEVRYEIESITSTLRNWQNAIDYSTVTLYLREVEELTEPVELHRTYWQEISDGLADTFKGIGSFFKRLVKWVIVELPVLAIIAVVALVIALVARRVVKRRKSKIIAKESDEKKE